MKEKKNNKLLDWFLTEGALIKEGNTVFAERIFMANSAVNWIKASTTDGTLNSREIEAYMKIVKLYLQEKIDMSWQNGVINMHIEKTDDGEIDEDFFETLNGE